MLIESKKKFKPIANGNVTDSGMIALTDEPLPCRKPKKEWRFTQGRIQGVEQGDWSPPKI